jgi:hypothetical protein
VTKLALQQDLNNIWSLSASVRVYWGLEGGEDLAEFHNSKSPGTIGLLPLTDPGHDDPFDPSVFVNVGVECRPKENIELRWDAFNILGWFDDTLNKRNYLVRSSAYRSEAPAFSLSAKVRF